MNCHLNLGEEKIYRMCSVVHSYQHSCQIYHKYFNDAYIKKFIYRYQNSGKLLHTSSGEQGDESSSPRSFKKSLCIISSTALKQIVKFTLSKTYDKTIQILVTTTADIQTFSTICGSLYRMQANASLFSYIMWCSRFQKDNNARSLPIFYVL